MSDLIEIKNQEIETFLAFQNAYAEVNPPPNEPQRIRISDAGILYWIKMVAVLASVLLVAMRTLDQFHKAASASFGSNLGWLAWAEAILAVFGIEGVLFALAANKAANRKTISPFWTDFGIGLTLLISFMAGVGQSLSIVQGLNQQIINWFTIGLGISLSMASFVAYVAGEILGQQLRELDIKYEKALDKYSEKVDEWQENLKNSWGNSTERKIVRSPLSASKVTSVHRSPFIPRSNERQNEQDSPKFDVALDYLRNLDRGEDLPSTRKLANDLGISIGTAHKALREYHSEIG